MPSSLDPRAKCWTKEQIANHWKPHPCPSDPTQNCFVSGGPPQVFSPSCEELGLQKTHLTAAGIALFPLFVFTLVVCITIIIFKLKPKIA